MSIYLGIDGGNSKTHALIVTMEGKVLGFGASGGSDFQEVGIEEARLAWSKAINEALDQANLPLDQLRFGCFCLAGADLPEDYELLYQTAEQLMHPVKVVVKNDTIAALRAGLHRNVCGVTVVVGTGFNAAGRGKDGQEIILPGLGYLSGDYGGGRWMGRQIIRAVLRAWDGRGPQTILRQPVLETMGVGDEVELMRCLRQNCAQDRILELVPLLFNAAYEGDEVAQSLLTFLGVEVGRTAGVLIRRLGLEKEEVPVVLSTSVFRGKGPLFLDVITETVHRVAPKAHIVTPAFVPVVGAALEALSISGITIDESLLKTLHLELMQKFPELIYHEHASLT